MSVAGPALPVEARLDPSAPVRRPVRMRLLVPTAQWPGIIGGSVAIALLAAPLYLDQSPWLALGAALSVFVAWHSFRASTRVPWFPGLIAFGACMQWVLAPWMVYRYENTLRVAGMAVEAADYFDFIVPATAALIAGMYLPLWWPGRVRPSGASTGSAVPASFRLTCEAMVAAGLVAKIVLPPFTPGSLRFFVLLVGHLAWVGAFGLLLAGASGWRLRVGAVLAVTAFINIADLQFLDLLTWGVCVALLLSFKYKPRPRVVLPSVAAMFVLFMALNAFKRGHRDDIRKMDLDRNERAALTGSTLYALLSDPAVIFDPVGVIGSVDRLNEGYIISRILAWVPSAEPFARGETIVTALRSAVVPRALDPDKYVVGGAEVIPRFTGLQLINGTSMGLSVPGELYANFGRSGAVLGTFVFGVLLGLVFRSFVRRARSSPLWWAWAPFMFVSAFSAEQGLAEVLNQISKAALVMWAVVTFAPGWAELRRSARRRPAPAVAS